MIELYRRMKQGPRAAMLKKVGIGTACFLVLAGSGILLGYILSDKGGSGVRETANTSSQAPKQRTTSDASVLSKRTPTDEEDTNQETEDTPTPSTSNTGGGNVVQRAEDTKLISEHKELFTTAFTLLNTYEQHIAGGRYTEASALNSQVKTVIDKITPQAIGADPRAAYSSAIMMSVQEVSNLLNSASQLYAGAVTDYQTSGPSSSGASKLSDGRAKVKNAEAAYAALN